MKIFPRLDMDAEQDAIAGEVSATSTDEDVYLWRLWTALAPQDISLMLRVDLLEKGVSLTLRNDSGDARFIWQDWVDAAMGYMKGFEVHDDGDFGYGRQIARADLRKPMVELCPLRVSDDVIEPIVKRTDSARMWTGWPPFDVQICKFELEQWFNACDTNLRLVIEGVGFWSAEREVRSVERVIEAVVSEENVEVKASIEVVEDCERLCRFMEQCGNRVVM